MISWYVFCIIYSNDLLLLLLLRAAYLQIYSLVRTGHEEKLLLEKLSSQMVALLNLVNIIRRRSMQKMKQITHQKLRNSLVIYVH